MGCVFGSEERALVMIEPPGDLLGAGVFEVHDGILVAIELRFVEESTGTVHQAAELERHILADTLAVEAREESGGTRAVETFIVKKYSDLQTIPSLRPKRRKQIGISPAATSVKQIESTKKWRERAPATLGGKNFI